ncbi:MAG: FmdB family zinc ribbon protein [Abditibacteriaceae bacterium]
MPTYEYKCKKCEHQFELWQEVGADAPECPECGAEVQKVFHPIRTIYKGSGFYITDSRPAASKSVEVSEAKESKPESISEAKTETKSTETKESSTAPKNVPAEKVS